MRSPALIDATDLTTWSQRRSAQETLPRVIRRLVQATLKEITRLGFPAGEGVQLGGWDGVVVAPQGNAHVPAGTSAWELGTGGDIKRKADSDYAKRTAAPRNIEPARSTFVFVTARRWDGKDEWVAVHREEGRWADVRAYDADDLEAWLDQAPAVHTWLSVLLGKHPEHVLDLDGFWADWALATQPAITPGLVLAGRQSVCDRVQEWLRNPAAPLTIQADSRDEAIAVFVAVIEQMDPLERSAYVSRALIVEDLGAWRAVTAAEEPLILVSRFESAEAVPRGMRGGHGVIVPVGNAGRRDNAVVSVPRLASEEAAIVLERAGIPHHRARDLAGLARQSFASFRRKIAISPDLRQPDWAHPPNARQLLPVMLAGAWRDDREGDRRALADLGGADYRTVLGALSGWVNSDDPPVRRSGESWYATSKEDEWSLLFPFLTADDVARFERVVLDVLGEIDPAIELGDDERWRAAIDGRVLTHSRRLRSGLADSLALMGASGSGVRLAAAQAPPALAERVVRRLLTAALDDWRLLISLADVMPLLAEAAPDAFLDAIDKGLTGAPPVVLRLFAERSDLLSTAWSPHTGLLWALEALAWSPDFLAPAALNLAKLVRLDPGGKLANRPRATLRSIFLLWRPQTSASLEQRLRVIDMLRDREPGAAWLLLRDILPVFQDTGSPTARPRWREWVPEVEPTVGPEEEAQAPSEIVARMLRDADSAGDRWEVLIGSLPALMPSLRNQILDQLKCVVASEFRAPDRARVWHAVRILVSKHRTFPSAHWALPKHFVDTVASLLTTFEPEDPLDRYGWLFTHTPELPDGRDPKDWKAHQERVREEQRNAVEAVLLAQGEDGLLRLVDRVELPGRLGLTAGLHEPLLGDESRVILPLLASESPAHLAFARELLAGRVIAHQREWGEELLAANGATSSAKQRAEMLMALPGDARTWRLAEAYGPETAREYWWRFNPLALAGAAVDRKEELEEAVRHLIEHRRPFAAIFLLSSHFNRTELIPAALIADSLEAVANADLAHDRPYDTFAHDVGRALDVLTDSDVAAGRTARLEWFFLPIVGSLERPPKLLLQEVSHSPEFFAELVRSVFFAERDEERSSTEDDQARARSAYELLTSGCPVPGSDPTRGLVAENLQAWIARARALLAESDRQVVGDQMIGQVLAGSGFGDDGVWPHPAVRAAIETAASPELEKGFRAGVHNARGVVSKGALEGGDQERALAEKYEAWAAAIRDTCPRASRSLRMIAQGYRFEAEVEDRDAEQREDLDG